MKYSGRDLVLAGMFLALALIIPTAFHAAGLGSSFLPMFYPILLSGFLTDLPIAVAVGLLAPLTSALLTGMPPFFPPYAFIMMAEGVFLAGLPAFLYKKRGLPVLPVLLITLLFDRIVLLATLVFASLWLHLPAGVLGLTSLVHGLPGLVLILVIMPRLIKELEKRIRRMPAME